MKNKVEHVREPLQRLKLTFQPVEPDVKPGISAPLERVAEPLQRLKLNFFPLVAYDLILTLNDDADSDTVFLQLQELLKELNGLSILSNGSPIEVDLKSSKAKPGELTLRLLIPGSPPAALVERALKLPTVRDTELRLAA
ncbi:MAG: hypothetical protein ACRC8S_07625 [Fimbriiglobus sp.]